MSDFIQVEGNEKIAKESFSGGIVNLDTEAISSARRMKAIRLRKLQEHDVMKEELDALKKDVSEIKNVLQKIAEKI